MTNSHSLGKFCEREFVRTPPAPDVRRTSKSR
jgi:hypothetical protein